MRYGWNHSIQYYETLLRAAPTPCARALDVGCGKGSLTRRLAERCGEVTGIDLERDALPLVLKSPKGNVSYIVGDVMTQPFEPGSSDLVTAVAVLHHLPLEAALRRFRHLLRPGGTLAVIGLFHQRSVSDHALAAAAWPASRVLRRFRGFTEMEAPVREPTETLREIRAVVDAVLPGAVIRRRLFFRYTLIWRKSQ